MSFCPSSVYKWVMFICDLKEQKPSGIKMYMMGGLIFLGLDTNSGTASYLCEVHLDVPDPWTQPPLKGSKGHLGQIQWTHMAFNLVWCGKKRKRGVDFTPQLPQQCFWFCIVEMEKVLQFPLCQALGFSLQFHTRLSGFGYILDYDQQLIMSEIQINDRKVWVGTA